MSFSYQKQSANRDEAKADLETSPVPAPIRDFIRAALDATKFDGRACHVSAFGHLHDGQPGNYEVSTCSIDVHPVVVAVEVAEERKLDTPNSEHVMSAEDAASKAGG